MKTLGNILIGAGLVLCATILFLFPGLILIGAGVFLRVITPRRGAVL